jgi:hypothetical protein
MPFKNEHSIRIKSPSGYSRYRRKNLTGGVDAVIGFKKGGGSEIQALRFDKTKFSIEEAKVWATKHGYSHPLEVVKAKDHISPADVSVRQPIKNVSVKLGNNPVFNHPEDTAHLLGQAGPGQGMGYIKVPADGHKYPGPSHSDEVTYGELFSDPQKDIPAGWGLAKKDIQMPVPKVADPKSSLTDIQIKQTQLPSSDDTHTLENTEEEKDLSGITYGTAAAPWKVMTRKPMYGLQRQIPSAYSEDSPDDVWDEIIDLMCELPDDFDMEELRKGAEHELEHTDNKLEAAKTALDHLVEEPEYYTKLKAAGL